MLMAYYVYILTNKRRGTLYTGVTNDLARRATEHREGKTGAFTTRYGTTLLACVEPHDDVNMAILREKNIKKWRREWKIGLIEEHNPDWQDLFNDFNR